MQILKKLIFLLSPRERRSAFLLLGMILLMAILDMLGVASILPFISLLSNPEIIETNIYLNEFYNFTRLYGVETERQFFLVVGIFVFLFLLFSLSFKVLTFYLQIKFSAMLEYSLSKQLVEGFLHQPYSWYLNQNSAELGKTILSEVGTVIHDGIKALIDLITYFTIALLLITLMILVNPKITLLAGFVFVFAYALFYKFIRNFLKRIGHERLIANELRFKMLNESFGGIKEIKVNNLEKVFINRFSSPAMTLAKHTAAYQIIGRLPRFVIEAIAFGGLVLMILYLMLELKTFLNVVPIISVYAFAGYRLIPALQQIYLSATALRYVGSSLNEVYNDFREIQNYKTKFKIEYLNFNKSINLIDVY